MTQDDDLRAAFNGAVPPRFGAVRIRDRGRLPHWEIEAGLYFITFRLADSLPAEVLQQIRRRRERAITGIRLEPRLIRWRTALAFAREQAYLDRGVGGCELRRDDVAAIVAGALKYNEGKRYRLLAWCIMPNHVHLVARLLPGELLDHVVQAWKSFTAHKACSLLRRTGEFWQREYYDHLIRNGRELDHVVRYIESNPIRAGLKDWKWVEVCGRDARTTAGETPALLR